jgi:hypothetical protein
MSSVVLAAPAFCDEPLLSQGQKELRKAAEALRPRPNLDTTPVELNIGGIRYRIPRNYLTAATNWNGGAQHLIEITVNLPDMKPLSPETLECFTTRPSDRKSGCEPFSFRVTSPEGVTADQAFANTRDLFHSQIPALAPFGYERYDIGPEDARGEYYRKVVDGRTSLYLCFISFIQNRRDGLCHPVGDRLTTGAFIQFFFALHRLGEISDIDADFRKLVEGFTVGFDSKK